MAPLAYAAVILFLRVAGKRMLSKMSAFDLVVTVALGSTLATILLSKDVSLAEGLVALALLLGLQYVVAWCNARSRLARRIFKSEPSLLYFGGQFLRDAMRAENVPEESIRSGMRNQGFGSVDEVHAVVLEADGSLSIVRRPTPGQEPTLTGLRNATSLGADGAPREFAGPR